MKQFFCIAIGAMMIFSCNNLDKKISSNNDTQKQKTGIAPSDKQEDKRAITDSTVKKYEGENKNPASKEPKANPDWEKKIIKTANVSLELKDFNAYNKNIHQNLKAYSAYIAQEEQTQTDGIMQNVVTIKVPVDRFDDLMNTFSGEGIKVMERKITTEDVTGDVIDTKGRIETKKQVRQQYMELLKQAKNMKDILEVQSEINGITEQVEAAGGRVQYLVHQAAYSTINLKYFQYTNGSKTVDEEPSFFSKLKEAFKSGGYAIANLALLLANIWPIVLIAFFGYLVLKRRNKSKQITK